MCAPGGNAELHIHGLRMKASRLIGKRVTVTLDGRPERANDPYAFLTGVLVEFEDDGGVTVDTDDRGRRYGWPALEIDGHCTCPDGPSIGTIGLECPRHGEDA